MRVRHKKFFPGQHKVAAPSRCRHPDATGIIAAALFGLGQGHDPFTRRDLGKNGVLLLVRAADQHGRTAQEHGRQERSGHQRPAHLFHHDNQIEKTPANPAVPLGNQNTHPAQLRGFFPELCGVGAVIFHHLAYERGRAFRVQEFSSRVAQQFLIFTKTEIHASPFTPLATAGRARQRYYA